MTAGRQAGFALLIVLWSLVLLALILTQLLSAGRSEAQLAANLRDAAAAEAVADGAVAEALFHLAAGGAQGWPPRGTHVVRIGRGVAMVAVDDLSGTVNPNTADLPLLRALLLQCGAAPGQATEVAGAIMSWRGTPLDPAADPAAAYRGLGYVPLGLPLRTLDELTLVAGMTRPLYACLAPHLSLFQPGDPAGGGADAVVARAVAAATLDGYSPRIGAGSTGVARVVATATVGGGRFVRRATARLAPVRVVEWQ